MKKLLLSGLLFCLGGYAAAQLPAPDSFRIAVQYITIDQSSWCDGQVVQGPNYCNTFMWQPPDTSNSMGSLTGYRIYRDGQLFMILPATQTQVDTAGALWGSFYVTAIYVNPGGESDPSNVAIITDLPFATCETGNQVRCGISFDAQAQEINVRDTDQARELWVFNLLGALVLHTCSTSGTYSTAAWEPGMYVAVLRDTERRVCVQRLVVGD